MGFGLGSWASDRFGRVPTFVSSSILTALCGLTYYWGPPHLGSDEAFKIAWLAGAFAGIMAAHNSLHVAANAIGTELCPTSVRNSLLGWLSGISAIGAIGSQLAIAVGTTRGLSLSLVAGTLGLLAVLSAGIVGSFVGETRGLSLESASGEKLVEVGG